MTASAAPGWPCTCTRGSLPARRVARSAPGVSLLIYGGLPVLYFLSITVLRGSRKRDQEYADFT
jgi:hypothetical protein